jgi:hypothetical protein
MAKIKKYEFYVFETGVLFTDWRDKVSKLQDDGWELAGSINSLKTDPNKQTYLSIPFKRLIK